MCVDPCGTANLTVGLRMGNSELNISLSQLPNDFLEKGKEQMRTGWVLWPSVTSSTLELLCPYCKNQTELIKSSDK